MFIKLAFKNVAHTWNPYDKIIGVWTNGKYCHVELWFSGDPKNAVCFSARAGSGTTFKTIDLTQAFDIVTVTDDNNLAIKCFNAARKLNGKNYDWLGILGFVLPLGEHDENDRFCSEVCYELLVSQGLLANEVPAYKVTPNELADKATFLFGAAKPLYSIDK